MALTSLRRRAPALVAALVLALVAGPAASAACAHLGETMAASGHAMEMPGMDHGDTAAAHDEPPPCHDAPAPAEKAPASHDCASACCASDAPTRVVPAPAPMASAVPTPIAVEVHGPEAAPPTASVPPTPSPPRPTRLHVEIGRFLI